MVWAGMSERAVPMPDIDDDAAEARALAAAVPVFADEAEERVYWERHDSVGRVDWGRARAARFANLKPSTTSISLGVPVGLLERIKIEANRRDVPYQSLVKIWLAEKVG